MKALRNRPIKTKLVVIALLVSGCGLLTAIASFLTYDLITFQRDAIARVGTVAEVVAANSTAALAFENREDASSNLALLQAEPHVLTACLYLADGVRFASYTRDESQLSCPPEIAVAPLRSVSIDRIVYASPLHMGGETVGLVWVLADTLNVKDRFRTTIAIGVLVMLVGAVVSAFLATRLQGVISAPILGLVSTSRRVTFEKNYSIRAERHGDDELGTLVDAFNQMLEQIQLRDLQLEVHTNHLDEEVKARTAQMELAILDLEAEIAQREKAEERIRYLAYYDVLTGLPNRRLLEERLDTAIKERSSGGQSPLALLFLDLDRFKEINDTYGHTTGDQLLQQVAERLVSSVRGSDQISRSLGDAPDATVSRQGGDEFMILLGSVARAHDASRVAKRILEGLKDPFSLPDRDVVIGASIGIAIYPDDGENAETLIKHADTAMYHAKENGRNDFEYFAEHMKLAALERLNLEADLRAAIDRAELELVFQPQVDLVTGEICKIEALLRWHHPTRGLVLPSEFIGIAEDCGLIVGIGEWVLREACEHMANWVEQGLSNLRVGVNVSSQQFRKGALLPAVLNALESAGLDADRLELEVTESSVIEEEEVAIATLSQLREIGVSVALDDFGTGYSSLSYLQRLPLDSLKIDRSFIRDLAQSEQGHSIVIATITMAHALGLLVVAEGIEDEIQLGALKGWGCDIGQGYFFSRPVAASKIPAVIESQFDQDDVVD